MQAFCDKEMSVASLKRFGLVTCRRRKPRPTTEIAQGDDKQADVDKLSWDTYTL